MTFSTLALISVVALLGPILAYRQNWHLPIVLGELAAGIIIGASGFRIIDAANPTFTLLANVGFALVMFVAGTHVPMRDNTIRPALWTGALRAVLVGVLAVPAGMGIAWWFDTGHAGLYAVLLASSSAALVLPIIDSLQLVGTAVLQLVAQVAIADTACIVALPLMIDPAGAPRAALGALAVAAVAGVLFVVLRALERSGIRHRAHKVSEDRKFALELRVSLAILFGLAALAVSAHVSIMLAGFAFGLVVAAVGEPRRLARQLFAITEGFFGPLFFVWLGASLDLRELIERPSFVLLGLALGGGAVVVHCLLRVLGQPLPLGALAAAQMGVPVAAATLGTQLHLLGPGEPAALMLGAVVTIGIAGLAGGLALRRSLSADAPT